MYLPKCRNAERRVRAERGAEVHLKHMSLISLISLITMSEFHTVLLGCRTVGALLFLFFLAVLLLFGDRSRMVQAAAGPCLPAPPAESGSGRQTRQTRGKFATSASSDFQNKTFPQTPFIKHSCQHYEFSMSTLDVNSDDKLEDEDEAPEERGPQQHPALALPAEWRETFVIHLQHRARRRRPSRSRTTSRREQVSM